MDNLAITIEQEAYTIQTYEDLLEYCDALIRGHRISDYECRQYLSILERIRQDIICAAIN